MIYKYEKWNEIKEESLISVSYEIYRTIDNLSTELVGRFSNYNSFQDDIESFQNYTQFCYYISALEEGAPSENNSLSNIKCVYLAPKVFIPEAFTPNEDGTNDTFKPVFSFIPKDYEIRVYNRWGNIIFETSDYSKEWNGKASTGGSVPAGTYIYLLRLKTPNNQTVEKRGNITVIYP